MSSPLLKPESQQELIDAVASCPRLLAIGNRSKPALSENTDATLLSLARFSGMVEYEPSEFTFTARAGTAVAEVVQALGERNQYLPFDPMFVESGATLGGTVAAGLSGPGRARYGGIRDFLLGVRFITGAGETINAGGKVVKNAAGFDIPKLMVGSLGRLGVMTQLTFKVFPRPPALQTLCVNCNSDRQAVERMAVAASSRWELDAIDYRPHQQCVFLRLGAPESVNDAIANDIDSRWGSDVSKLASHDAAELWRGVTQLNGLSDAGTLVKVPITPSQFLKLRDSTKDNDGLNIHVSVAGAVAWIAVPAGDQLVALEQALEGLGLSGLVIRGPTEAIWIGRDARSEMAESIKRAMDPADKFPALSMKQSVN